MDNESSGDRRKAYAKMLNPSTKQLKAIGAIAVELNSFESQLFQLFAHHYERLEWGTALPWHFYNLLQDGRRGEAITEIFTRLDTPDVCEHIKHALDYFNICNGNRNHIFHTPHTPSFVPSTVMFIKAVKANWDTLNVIAMFDPQLQRIASDTRAGSDYAFMIVGYLKKRDMPKVYPAEMISVFPSTLPKKPPLPPKLNPFQYPRAEAAPGLQFGGQPPESEPH